MPRSRAGLVVLAALLAAPAAAHAATPVTTLDVFAAASLSQVFDELGAAFERAHPGTKVRFSFAGSQALAAQIEQGAGADVFASADDRWMEDARAHGRLDGAPVPFVRNRVVAIVPATDPGRVHDLEGFARGGLKLVVAADAVPVGRYTRLVLANLARQPGFPPDFAKRVLASVVSEEDNVKAVLGKVRLGEADGGFVYVSDATGAVRRYLHVIEIPAAASVVATYPVAVVRDSPHAELARAFVDLLLSPAGQAALARAGFEPIAPAKP